jgi:S-adenosylmethionine:tRNA ribosyltransferase-isomerase
MRVDLFDFDLPEDLIAQFPAAERTGSRLLHAQGDALHDRHFQDLPGLLAPGDLLVMNDTRVLKARLRGHKVDTGGAVEALVERVTGVQEALVQLRASKATRPGAMLQFGAARARMQERRGEFFLLHFETPVLEVLEREGQLPLPPYITHAADGRDEHRYQTVYAREPGAVAAPTAGLHFDAPLLQRLAAQGVEQAFVTLHVGAGTFQPVRVEDLSQHRMHFERWELGAETADAIARTRARGGRVIAVGTTSLRTLESACDDTGRIHAGAGDTDLFLLPGRPIRVVDRLITNFHLPRSTLMMLVSAFAGVQRIRRTYAHAIAQRYRFFSYGDAMLLERCADALAE